MDVRRRGVGDGGRCPVEMRQCRSKHPLVCYCSCVVPDSGGHPSAAGMFCDDPFIELEVKVRQGPSNVDTKKGTTTNGSSFNYLSISATLFHTTDFVLQET